MLLTQEANNILRISIDYIENFSDEIYPTNTQLANYVNKNLPDKKITIEDINTACEMIVNLYPDRMEDAKLNTVYVLINEYKKALASRITDQSNIKNFILIFALVFGGYVILKHK